jgi:hypothetical protein
MGDADDQPTRSRLRFVVKELALLAVGLVVLFIAFGLVLSVVARIFGWSMCCQ